MDSKKFSHIRKRLDKTQEQLAQLLGTSVKAVRSYEQGWRPVSTHVERQLFVLLSCVQNKKKRSKPCWVIKKCPISRRKRCPAWEFHAGTLCWFINGTICECEAQKSWKEKIMICERCEVLAPLLDYPEAGRE